MTRPPLTALRITHLFYTFGTGLLAGVLYAFEQGVRPALAPLDGPAYAVVQQGLLRELLAGATGVVPLSVVALALPLYPLVALWQRRGAAFWLLTLVGWLLFAVGAVLFTVLLPLPSTTQLLSWNPGAPPVDWATTRDAWNAYAAVRTPLIVSAFLLHLWAGVELYRVPGRRSAYN